MAWFEHDETKIHYEETGAGDPLLLVPGWGGSFEDLAGIRAALSANFRVIAADPPGSGKSSPQPRTYTASYYADDSRVFLAMLKAIDAYPAHIAGFSDGGEYGLLMAGLDSGAVRSLATWGAAGSLGTNADFANAMEHMIDSPIPPMQEYSTYLKATYGDGNARVMTQSAGRAFRQIIESRGGDISRSLAAKMTCPTLLITGEHDFLATPALVGELASAMPHAEFIEAKGASHAVHHDQPEWLEQTVTGWFAKRSTGAIV